MKKISRPAFAFLAHSFCWFYGIGLPIPLRTQQMLMKNTLVRSPFKSVLPQEHKKVFSPNVITLAHLQAQSGASHGLA
jgi:hypothetical protein